MTFINPDPEQYTRLDIHASARMRLCDESGWSKAKISIQIRMDIRA